MTMRLKLRGSLRVFLRAAPAPLPADPSSQPPPIPVVGLTVFTGDSIAFGYVPLAAGRVTDLMNDCEDYEFVDTHVRSLEDGRSLELRAVVIEREEILVVGVAGPRGDPTRRTRTRPIPVELRLGPYDVRGNIHVVPGTDPMVSFRSRRPMVPLTEATVEWDAPGGREVVRWATVVVNRPMTDWIAPAVHDVRPPDLQPVLGADGSGLARSFAPRLVRG